MPKRSIDLEPRTDGERMLASKARRLGLHDLQDLPGLRDITPDGLRQLPACFPEPVQTAPTGRQEWDRRHVLAWWRRVHPRGTTQAGRRS